MTGAFSFLALHSAATDIVLLPDVWRLADGHFSLYDTVLLG